MGRSAQTDCARHATGRRNFQPGNRALLRDVFAIDRSTAAIAVELIAVQVRSETDIKNVIRKVGSEPDGGLFVLPDSHNVVHRKLIIELVAEYRLPAIYYFRYFASDGGLIAYGPDEMDIFVRTASYVDRILKGASPSDLPVQQPTKFELVINLK